jgi:hypothetical protein
VRENQAAMSKRSFTAKAELLWHTVPAKAKDQILKNVFCTRCKGSVEIVDYTGSEKNGDLVLEGSSANCGHRMVRVVETSEAPPTNN